MKNILIIRFLKKYLPYLFLVSLSLIPLFWLINRPGILINGSDTNFPLNPEIWFTRRLFVWNSVVNAGMDFSSSMAGLFFHFLQFLPYKLGLGLQQVQIFTLIFWFAAIIFSSFFLAKTMLPKKRILQILFVVFYTFNTYIFNTWENVKVANLALVAAIPLVISIYLKLVGGKINLAKAGLLALVGGISLSGAGINPAYFLTCLFSLAIFFLASLFVDFSWQNVLKKAKYFLFVNAIVFVVNLFWILPTTNYIFKSITATSSIQSIGYTNWIDSLSENTSLLNVARLQGAWDWYAVDSSTNTPLYIPYAYRYFNNPFFIGFSLVFLFLSILSFIFFEKEKKLYYLAFSIALVLGLFLGAGTHSPTGVVFRFLVTKVPFFSLFRSPWYIFTPLLFLSYAGLISLLFYSLSEKMQKLNSLQIKQIKTLRMLLNSVVLLLILGNLVYNYPLVMGRIYRPAMSDNFLINFPTYVFDAGKWLNESKFETRVIGYPNDEIERFSWGYNGVDSVLGLISNQETLFSSLNQADFPISRVIAEFYRTVKRDELSSASLIANKLNVGVLWDKKDQTTLSLPLPASIADKKHLAVFGKWEFLDFPTNKLAKMYTADKIFFDRSNTKGEKILGLLASQSILVNPNDSVVGSIAKTSIFTADAIVAGNSQATDYWDFINTKSNLIDRLTSRNLEKVDFTFQIEKQADYSLHLERFKLEEFGLDIGSNLKVKLDGKDVELRVKNSDDSFVHFESIVLAAGEHQLSFGLDNKNLIEDGNFNQSVLTYETEGEGEFQKIAEGTASFVVGYNASGKDAFLNVPLTPFDPRLPYMVEVKYKQIYGNNAAIVIRQQNTKNMIKSQVERFPNYPEWKNFSFYYQPVETNSQTTISLVVSSVKDALGTKILYDDLAVYKVFTNNLVLLEKNTNKLLPGEVSFVKVNPTLYRGKVTKATGGNIIVFSDNYSANWKMRLVNSNGKKLDFDVPHFSTNLYANAWYLDNLPESYDFEIYYEPQNLFIAGMTISLLAATTIIGGFVYFRFIHKTKKLYE
ncbi:MAG: hypothetical protein AAB546_03300 [Patescibacteria group bacterium]